MRDRLFKTRGPLDPVKDQAILVVRRDLWQLLRLATQPGVSSYVALLSPRQTGKTTLLYQARALLKEKDCGVALVDLSPLENRDEAECYRFVCRQILAELGGQLRLSRAVRDKLEGVTGPTEFRDFLWEVAQRARPARLVIMLDEVRAVPLSMSSAFFGVIRSTFTSRHKESEQALEKYMFILAGAAELGELTSGKNSPLNICETIYLKDFDADGVWALVSQLGRLGVQVSREASDYIYQQTKGHPYLTQRLCSLLEIREAPAATIPAIDEAVSEIVRSDDHLDHIARQLEQQPEARELARQIAARRREISFSRVNHLISRLEMIGVIADSDPCAIRNPIYQRALQAGVLHPRYSAGTEFPRSTSKVMGWKGRRALSLLLILAFFLALPTIVLYTTEVLFTERFVNQPIAVPALNVTGFIRHESLISAGKEEEVVVEISRSPAGGLSPVQVELSPKENDLTSADGRYSLVYSKEHESQSFLIKLRKSVRLQDLLFPFASQRQRRIDFYLTAAPKPGSSTGINARAEGIAPCYTATMKVDYFSSFMGSVLVGIASLVAGIVGFLSRFDTWGEWLDILGSGIQRRLSKRIT